MDSITKICTQCKEEKRLEDFYRQKGCRDGRRPECKACANKRIDRCHKEVPMLRRIWGRVSNRRNFEKNKETKKIYTQKNKEKIKQTKDVWREKNKDTIKNKAHKYYLENKEKFIEKLYKRKAIAKGTGGVFTGKDWKEVLQRYGNNCLRCGSSEKIVKDHVIPLSRGGMNDKYNLQPLCSKCNLQKFTQSWDFRFDKGVWHD